MKPRFLRAITLIGLCVAFAGAAARAAAITVALAPNAPPGTPQVFTISYDPAVLGTPGLLTPDDAPVIAWVTAWEDLP